MSLERAMAKVLEWNFWAKDFLRTFFKTQMFDECFHDVKKQKQHQERKNMLFHSVVTLKKGMFSKQKSKNKK